MKLPGLFVMLALLPGSDVMLFGSVNIVANLCFFQSSIFFFHFFTIFLICFVSFSTRFESRLNCATNVFLSSFVILRFFAFCNSSTSYHKRLFPNQSKQSSHWHVTFCDDYTKLLVYLSTDTVDNSAAITICDSTFWNCRDVKCTGHDPRAARPNAFQDLAP